MLSKHGELVPLIIPSQSGLMNPSILRVNNEILITLRQVNYTFYHSEKNLIHHPFGPLTYIHPENDIKLRTWNWILHMNEDLSIREYHKVDTSQFDTYEPKWEFVGLEDARLVYWNDKLYQTGVRRDTTPNGQGRMELSEIDLKNHKEIQRVRIDTPIHKNSYCEKNWMPIVDKPFEYVKWTNPTEVVQTGLNGSSKQLKVADQPYHFETRGGSQVIPYKDGYAAITHDTILHKSNTGRKNATYRHRFIQWDKNWNMTFVSEPWDFMDGQIEFCAGMMFENDHFYITFGFQDNAAFVLKIKENELKEYMNARALKPVSR